jgi:hypothetical protein
VEELVIDNPEKTSRLLVALNMALPFEVELVSALTEHLRAEYPETASKVRHVVSRVSYAGDAGGIMCHIERPDGEGALVASLTHVRVSHRMPLAAAVAEYKNHRIKKLKKQSRR